VVIAGIGVPTWRPAQPQVVRRLGSFVRHPNVRFVGTRDVESSAWIADHLHPDAPIVTAPDLVYALTLPPATRPDGPPILGVAVRAGPKDDHLKQVRRLCDRAVERGYRIRRIALSSGITRRIDVEALDGLDLPETELVASDDLTVLTRAIGECSLVASMKFHGVVVATMYGIPTIALGATTKHRNLMAGLERPELRVPYTDPSLPDILDREIPPIDEATRDRLREAATANVAAIREHLLAATGAAAS
jgi:polysaccharide pyruvyl transferase WcaK-like protein